MSKPDVLAVAKLHPFYKQALDLVFTVHDRTHETDPAGFASLAPRILGIAGTGEASVPRSLLTQLPKAKVVSVFGVGYDGVDVPAAIECGIPVTHTPNVLTDDVADLAMGLVLSVGRAIPQADQFVRAGRWPLGPMALGRKVSGARIGIVQPFYPDLVLVPGYPVYYAPQARVNCFFYDGFYWVFQDERWYRSAWYDGPWDRIDPYYVPLFVLRVPVRYYVNPPRYFHGWLLAAPQPREFFTPKVGDNLYAAGIAAAAARGAGFRGLDGFDDAEEAARHDRAGIGGAAADEDRRIHEELVGTIQGDVDALLTEVGIAAIYLIEIGEIRISIEKEILIAIGDDSYLSSAWHPSTMDLASFTLTSVATGLTAATAALAPATAALTGLWWWPCFTLLW